MWLATNWSRTRAKGLSTVLDGVGVVMEGRRFYPKGPLLSHVLGFAGMDDRGLEGVELRYEQYLRGEKRTVVFSGCAGAGRLSLRASMKKARRPGTV